MSRSRSAAGAIALLLVGSCDGSTDPGDVRVPAELLIVAGDDQSGVVGRELADPLVVRVQDQHDEPVPGQVVNFVVTAGNGSVFAGTSLTNEDGEARELWTLGTSTADSQRVEARAVESETGAKLVFATFAAIALPDDPDSLVAVAGDEQEGTVGTPLPDSLAVRVLDQYGNPVPAVDVTWTTNEEGGQLDPDSSTTNARGVALTLWTLGSSAGKQTVSAKHNELEERFAATAIAGSIVRVEVTPDTIHLDAIGNTRKLAATAFDRDGNKVANPAIEWATSKGFVAAVNAHGRVRARRNGTALITARAEGQVDTATAIVKQVAGDVRFTGSRDSLLVGDTLRLYLKVADSGGTEIVEPEIRWRSSDESIVQVDSTGLGTGVGRGVATVVAQVDQVSDSLELTILRRDSIPPLLEIVAPVPLSVARPEIRVAATCSDDDPEGCESLVVLARRADSHSRGDTVAYGTQAIDTVVSLEAFDGSLAHLIFEAHDPLDTTRIVRPVYVESSPALVPLDSVSGEIWDIGTDRILHLDSASGHGILKLFDRASRTDVVINGEPTPQPQHGFVTPVGALFETGGPTVPERLKEWRNGVLTDRGPLTSGLLVTGNYAIWSNRRTLTRYDIGTGVETIMATDAGGTADDVTANGDVAYWTLSYDIFLYRAGETTRLTSDDDEVVWNTYPLTDGTIVVYRKHDPCCTDQRYWIAMYGVSGERILFGPSSEQPQPKRDYAVNGGWVAYTKSGSDALEIWLRSPRGTQERVTTLPSRVSFDDGIESLSLNGDLVIISADRRYRWSPTTGAAPADIGSSLGRSLWLGNQLLVIIGNTVFRVQ